MKSMVRMAGLALLLTLMAMVSAGCSSAPKIDWDERVGSYTYDEAVTDMGPPDKSTTLSDGSRVAEWAVGRGRSSGMSFGVGTGYSTGRTGVGIGQSVGTGRSYRDYLRLTFDDAGVLKDWLRVKN